MWLFVMEETALLFEPDCFETSRSLKDYILGPLGSQNKQYL